MKYLGVALVLAPFVSAASLQSISNWGGGPNKNKLTMDLYVPDNVVAKPPIVLALHPCGGSGSSWYSGSNWKQYADQYGFIVIYPTQTTSNCWDVTHQDSLAHDGGGDSTTLANMVKWTIANKNADASRVFSTGFSSGGMMTQMLMAVYPDIFAAGAEASGVPYRCFDVDAPYTPTQPAQNCAAGTVTKSAQQWGDLVRGAYPGYSGPRPRVMLVHGAQDTFVSYNTFAEAQKQWSNVLGVSQTSQSTTSEGYTRTRYGQPDALGQYPLDAISVPNLGHGVATPSFAYMLSFFELDKAPITTSKTTTTTTTTTTTRPASPSPVRPSPSPVTTGNCVAVTVTSTTVLTTTSYTTVPCSAASPTPSPVGDCAGAWAQCGGKGWTGANCCTSGYTCKANGDYYSQCLP